MKVGKQLTIFVKLCYNQENTNVDGQSINRGELIMKKALFILLEILMAITQDL